ncbi:MAG TPA: exopolysaccharide biosynthesis protein [Gaiellales bacterium]|nr:exopolysaccharide biosynthesis protein [Gaiellales bacterium]
MAEAEAGQSFSEEVVAWLRSDEPKTLGAMNDRFAEEGFAVNIMMLMLLPALPLPTGGVTHVFEAITVLLAAQMVLGRRSVWLPDRFKRRQLGSLTTDRAIPVVARWIGRVERISKPRGTWLFDRGPAMRLIGLVLMAFAIAAALAPPFSGLDTLPALGAVVVCLSIVLRDVVLLGIGIVLGALGIALILTLGTAVVHFVGGFV